MKIGDIVIKYNVDYHSFERYLRNNNLKFKETLLDIHVEDSLVESYVSAYKVEQQKLKEEREREAQLRNAEEAAKQKAMAEMLITSGFSFDGYKITKYSGYISGDDAISVDRGLAIFGTGGTNVKDELMNSLVKIRRNALRELKEAAYDLGCNAVIGVDFDYLTLDPQTANFSGGTTYQPYVFGVTANGNAVVIEKIEE